MGRPQPLRGEGGSPLFAGVVTERAGLPLRMEGAPLVPRRVSRGEMPLIRNRFPGGGLSCDIVRVGDTCWGGKVASRDGRDGEAETKKEDIIYYPRSSSGVSVFLRVELLQLGNRMRSHAIACDR